MYGSYGSYSSMSSLSAPMDIGVNRSTTTSQAAACAFPSWPRRSSLSESECEHSASSYLSDEDLFPSDPFEDSSDARSVSSAGSASPAATPPLEQPPPALSEEQLLEMQRERQAYQREVMRFLLNEKERRRQAAKRARRGSNSAGAGAGKKGSPGSKSKLASMTPIAEAGGE